MVYSDFQFRVRGKQALGPTYFRGTLLDKFHRAERAIHILVAMRTLSLSCNFQHLTNHSEICSLHQKY